MIKAEPLDYNIKHKDILNASQKKIREEREIIGNYLKELDAQVEAYIDKDIEYSTLKPLTLQDKEETKKLRKALKRLYKSNEDPVKKMKEEVIEKYMENDFSHNGERCPYCGILRQSTTDLDHFLPKGTFPEYSILPLNLVYICTRCNSQGHKGTLINDNDTGRRLFLHPYTDQELGEYCFLECSIDFDELMVLPTFTVNQELLDINPEIYHIACNHMKKLKLNKRYSSLVETDLLFKFRNKFTKLNNDTGVRQYKDDLTVDDFVSFINEKIEECDQTDITNWEIVFWKEFLKATKWFSTLAGKELEK